SPRKRLEQRTDTIDSWRGYPAQLRRAPRQYGDPSPRLPCIIRIIHRPARSRRRGDTRVPSVKIASSTRAAYVELVQDPFDGTIQRMSSVYRSTSDYSHSTDSVAQVYFVKDAVEPDLLAGSNTVFSREETKDSEAAMLLIREIDEGMGGGHSLSHGDYGEQVPSNSRRCSTFRRVVVHSPSTSAIGVQYGLRMIVPPPSGTSSHSVSAQNPLTSPPIRWQFDSDHSASSALLLPRESRSPSSPGVLFEPALAAGPADQPSRSV
ncbi:hypothetical protein CF319_g9622, partial [Tilletia indica]